MMLLGPEMLINGGFETGDVASWDTWYPTYINLTVSDDWTPVEGDNDLWVEVSCREDYHERFLFQQPLTTIVSGAGYFLDFHISTETASEFNVRMCAADVLSKFYGLDEAIVPTTYHGLGGATAAWEQHTMNFESSFTGSMMLLFVIPEIAADAYDYIFDAVSLRRRIQIKPGYGYKNKRTLDRILSRGIDGDLRVYTGPGEHRRISAPVSWVSSADASVINSWWQTGTSLRFIENDNYTNSYQNVRIIGNKQPLDQHQYMHYGEYLTGTLIMETV